jgi:hypothetical protein
MIGAAAPSEPSDPPAQVPHHEVAMFLKLRGSIDSDATPAGARRHSRPACPDDLSGYSMPSICWSGDAMEDSTNLSDRADRRPVNPIQQTIQRDTPDVIDPEVSSTNPYSPRMRYRARWT